MPSEVTKVTAPVAGVMVIEAMLSARAGMPTITVKAVRADNSNVLIFIGFFFL